MSFISTWLASWKSRPQPMLEAEENKWRVSLLRNAALGAMAMGFLMAGGVILGARLSPSIVVVNFLIIVMGVLLYYCVQQQKIALASLVLVVFTFTFITGSVVILGTIRVPPTAAFLLWVLLVGALYNRLGILLATLISSFTILGLIWAENMLWLPTPDYAVNITQWITYTMFLGAAGALMHIGREKMTAALVEAKKENLERQRVEVQLQESQKRLQALTNATAQSFILLDGHSNVLAFNKIAAHLMRISLNKELAEGASMYDYIFVEDFAEFTSQLEAVRQGAVITVEKTFLMPQSEPRIFSITHTPAYDDAGQLLGVCLNGVDITERKLVEEAMRQSEKRFRSLIENAPIGIVLTQSHVATYANPAALEMFGALEEQMQNTLSHDWIAPQSKPQFAADSLQRAAGLRTTNEFLAVRRDGSQFPALIVAKNLPQEANEPSTTVGFIQDMTELRHAQDRLRQLSLAVEQGPVSIVITDITGTIEYVNPRFSLVTGYSSDEVIGQNPRLLKSGLTPPETYTQLWQALTAGREWEGEFINRKKNGEVYYESAKISPLVTSLDRHTHYVAIKEDITARKELEKLRDDLMHMLVHDLRNPITVIRDGVELLEAEEAERLLGLAERNELVATLLSQTHKVLGFVDELLNISRLESKHLPLVYGEANLEELIGRIVQQQAPLAHKKMVSVQARFTTALPSLHFDTNLIERVLQNLIGNAIKFTPAEGQIVVEAARLSADMVKVYVRDTGIGVPAQLRPRLFQKFVRGSSSGYGHGLGLAFCRLAIEAHGGQIGLEESLTQGSTFFFTLPVVAIQPA